MAYVICLTIFLAVVHLLLTFTHTAAAAASQNDDPKRPIFVAKRLTLRSHDPLTRRSPQTNFIRFGRSGPSGGDHIAAGLSKIHVKREAFDLAAAAAAAQPESNAAAATAAQSSIRCVPDADSNAGIVCYTPSEVKERFALVTAGEDAVDDDSADKDEETDDETYDQDGGDKFKNETRPKRKETGSTLGDVSEFRYGSSTSNADHDAFRRLVRGRDSFLRLGRGSERDQLPHGSYGGSHLQPAEEDDDEDKVISIQDTKRSSPNFIRFGRTPSHDSSQPDAAALHLDDPDRHDDEINNGDSEDGDLLARYRRRHDNFLRLGRRTNPLNQMRFGRSDRDAVERLPRSSGFIRFGRSSSGGGGGGGGGAISGDDGANTFSWPSVDRLTRRSSNFLRFGRNQNFMRFGRKQNFMRFGRSKNFIRFGRSSDAPGYSPDTLDTTHRADDFLRMGGRDEVGHSRTCDLLFVHLPPSLLHQLLNNHGANQSTNTGASLRTDSDFTSDSGSGSGSSSSVDSISDSDYNSIVECIRRYSSLGLLDVIYPTRPMIAPQPHLLGLGLSAQSSPNTNDDQPSTRHTSGWRHSDYRFYEMPNSVHNVYRIPSAEVV